MAEPLDSAPRPEQAFFADPVVDRLMGTTIALATEVYMLRSRLRALEARLGVAEGASELSPKEQEAQRGDAQAFVAHVLGPLMGEQQSRGPL